MKSPSGPGVSGRKRHIGQLGTGTPTRIVAGRTGVGRTPAVARS
ncbi:hypothetical protein Ae706Ps2_2680 [Pseudonocardia sp. Ae706_Ps2]|nr:hypothetical protein Ae505Ps2_2622c [Pseudonocardia sp. Ae505_Ps2]OLM24247.1 hypothetical protein Ae706Ps2_2680 [Pseudonocardia sp. Ae706_Ps2]